MSDTFFKDRHSLVFATNPVGSFYLPDFKSDVIVKTIRHREIYDAPIVKRCLELVTPDSEFLDVGANVGQMSIALSKACKRVYSIEADPYMTYILHKNIAVNKAWNCTVISAAAWDEDDQLLPYPDPNLGNFDSLGSYGIAPTSTSERKVHSVKIDSLDLKNVSCIKIDTQGSDFKTMRGAIETINRCKPAIIFEYESIFNTDFSTDFPEYLRFIGSIGYEISEEISQNNFLILPSTLC